MQMFNIGLTGRYCGNQRDVKGSKPSIAVKRVLEGVHWLERGRTTARGSKPLMLGIGESLTITVTRTA